MDLAKKLDAARKAQSRACLAHRFAVDDRQGEREQRAGKVQARLNAGIWPCWVQWSRAGRWEWAGCKEAALEGDWLFAGLEYYSVSTGPGGSSGKTMRKLVPVSLAA